jgi:hypothetical protein
MSNETPYWIKWIGGIASAIVVTYVTVNHMDNKSELNDEYWREYHSEGTAFKFKYPAFLKHVTPVLSIEDSDSISIMVVVGNSDPSFFDVAFSRSGRISIAMWPRAVYDLRVKSDVDTSQRSVMRWINPHDSNPTIFNREISINHDQPSTSYIVNPIEDINQVRVEYSLIGEDFLLDAIGFFPDSVWEENEASIEKAIKSIEIDENAASRWYEGHEWFGIATRRDVDGNKILDAENGALPYCIPSIWSQKRLEILDCELTNEYENLNAIRFKCPSGRGVGLIQSRADCDKLRGANYATDNDTSVQNQK